MNINKTLISGTESVKTVIADFLSGHIVIAVSKAHWGL